MMTISFSNCSSTDVDGTAKGDKSLLDYAASKGRDPIIQQLPTKVINRKAKE